jgi:hypothetical protein
MEMGESNDSYWTSVCPTKKTWFDVVCLEQNVELKIY